MKKELCNYRHSSLQMVIEQSFGVLKARFPFLSLMPNFKRSRQHYVIIVHYALHNFIRINNQGDELFNTWEEVQVEGSSTESQANGNTGASNNSAT